MTVTRYPRPCPIPGHPQDEASRPLVTDSAWSRLRAWHLHAPAERLPLPLCPDRLAGRLGACTPCTSPAMSSPTPP